MLRSWSVEYVAVDVDLSVSEDTVGSDYFGAGSYVEVALRCDGVCGSSCVTEGGGDYLDDALAG